MSNDLRFRALLEDKVSAGLDKMQTKFQALDGGVKNVSGTLGKLEKATGGLISPTKLLAGGVLGLGAVLFDAGRAAAEEQVNIAKLGASLRANVKDWDGNTAAIEETIAKREDLAFSDDSLRSSLALLVASTKDVNKAFAIQRTAMDLARLKGISLEDAAQALIKVEAGQYRALKALGIVLKEGADQTEALAAVQKVAAGQADAYANTTAGAWDRINIKLEDYKEAAGDAILKTLELPGAFADGFRIIASNLPTLGGVTTAFSENAKAVDHLGKVAGDSHDPLKKLGKDIFGVGDQADKATPKVEDFLDAVFGPAQLQGEKAGKILEISDLKKEIEDIQKKGPVSTADKLKLRELRGQLSGAREDLIKLDIKLAALGDAPAKKDLQKFLNDRRNQTALWNDELRESYALIAAIAGTGGSLPKVPGSSSINPDNGKAEGGWVGLHGEEVVRVGEQGPEYIVPNDKLGSMGAGGGSTVIHTHINLDGRQIAEVVDEHLYYADSRASPSAVRK